MARADTLYALHTIRSSNQSNWKIFQSLPQFIKMTQNE